MEMKDGTVRQLCFYLHSTNKEEGEKKKGRKQVLSRTYGFVRYVSISAIISRVD